MKVEDVIIIGAGPCGLAAAISLQEKGFNPLVIERGNIVHTLYQYPTHQTFFSSSEKLEIGDVAFVTEQRKPTRNQALSYYREVVKRKQIRIHSYELVEKITKEAGQFTVSSDKQTYVTPFVIIATGYYNHPNLMGIPGEQLPKVSHYFKEAHPYFNQKVVVIGGKNSAIDAALELHKAGAKVTVLYRGNHYSESIKPWILPEFESLVRHGEVDMRFQAIVEEISEWAVTFHENGKKRTIATDFVFAMTGYKPHHSFLEDIGILVDGETGRPDFKAETMETNVPGVFIAGVIAAGNNANEIFIENGRFHGDLITAEIVRRTRVSQQ